MLAEQQIFSQIPCGIFSFTEDGSILFANNYCCNILEYPADELIHLKVENLLTISGKIFYQTHFFPLVKLHQHTEEIFLNLRSKTKKDVPIVLNAVMATVDDAVIITCSFLPVLNRRKYEDEILIARKKAEDALQKNEELERVKNELEQQHIQSDHQNSQLRFQNTELVQLSSIISHDLQEPVRKLIFFSNELLADNIDGDKKTHALNIINRSAKKAKTLLLNLQDYMGLTAMELKKEQVDVHKIITRELSELKKTYPHIQVDVTLSSIPVIAANENQLHILFHHLLDNAFVHGSIDDKLSVSINAVVVKQNVFNNLEGKYMYADHVMITVADKGPGFNPSYNEYIFEVMKRLNVSVEGIGLGLAFCRRIAENHHGYIKGEGVPGVGATFTVTLPVY